MKAAVYTRYGPPEVVRIAEVPTPVPKDNEVLIRIHAATVSTGDMRLRSANVPRGFGLIIRLLFGITGPRQPILGTELSGVIESVGLRAPVCRLDRAGARPIQLWRKSPAGPYHQSRCKR